jgi:plasmid rolling circle replication initiator protein Rep
MSILAQSSSFCRLFEQSTKCRRLTEAKLHTFPVIAHYAASDLEQYQKYAEQILNCSNDLKMRVFQDFTEEGMIGRSSIENARWCRVRHCPMCQFARSSKMRAKLFKAFSNYEFKSNYTFLTLTIRNRPLSELRIALAEMSDGWSRLRKRRTFPVLGFLRSMEVTMQRDRLSGDKKKNTGPPTRSPDGELMAHPHFHIILELEDGFDIHSKAKKAWLIDEWTSALRVDYRPSVKADKIRPNNGDFAEALLETCKYTVKPGDFSGSSGNFKPSKKSQSSSLLLPKPHGAEWLYGITEQLHGLKAVRTGGTFAKICSQKELDQIDDSISFDDEVSQFGDLLRLVWNDLRSKWDIEHCSTYALQNVD